MATFSYGAGTIQEVRYNNQALPLVSNLTVTGRAEYDQTGRTILGYRLLFSLETVFSGCTQRGGEPPYYEDFRGMLADFCAAIATPGKAFEVKLGGAYWLWLIVNPNDVPANYSSGWTFGTTNLRYDMQWGPKPQVMDVQPVIGGQSARIRWQLEAFVQMCSRVTDVLEFSWATRYAFDRNFSARRTVTGRYSLRSPNPAAETFLQNDALFPSLPAGFHRESIDWSVSADGLTLDFVLQDVQDWRTLPRPITNGSAIFRIEQQGAKVIKNLSGFFEAPIDTPKHIILFWILDLIRKRFPMFLFLTPEDFTRLAENQGKQSLRDAANALLAGKGANAIDTRAFEKVMQISFTNYEFENRIDFAITTQTAASKLFAVSAGGGQVNNKAPLFADLLGDVQDIQPTPQPSVAGQQGEDGKVGDESEYLNWQQIDGFSAQRSIIGTARRLPVTPSSIPSCDENTLMPVLNPNQSPDMYYTMPSQQRPASSQGYAAPSPGDITNYEYANTGSAGSPSEPPVTSEAHQAYPYEHYIEHFAYIVDYNLVHLPTTGTADHGVVQQTTYPTMRIVQTGVAQRLGMPPEVPEPALTDNAGALDPNDRPRVAFREVRPQSPQIDSDGITPIFKTSWSYVIILPATHNIQNASDMPSSDGTATRAYFPLDPRLNTAPQSIGDRVQKAPARTPTVGDDGTYTTTRQQPTS